METLWDRIWDTYTCLYILDQFGDIWVCPKMLNLLNILYLLLSAILMEEMVMTTHSILTCSAFPIKRRHDEADCRTNRLFLYVDTDRNMYIHVYIYNTYYTYICKMLHHHAHLPSFCSISSFEILKRWFKNLYIYIHNSVKNMRIS